MHAVRSHAVACFLIGLGHEVVDVEYQGTVPVYLFRDAAYGDMARYTAAKAALDTLAARKTSGGAL